LFEVTLGRALAAKETTDLQVTLIYTHVQTPFPVSIAQNEKQLVRLAENAFFYSPYTTQTQKTSIKLPSTRVESKTEVAPTLLKGDTLTYGPYENVKPYSSSDITVHFENNRPFITVRRLVREIEISHWGNVAVEETYEDLAHDGAKLKGAFSRYDYQRNPAAAACNRYFC
jgi:oligosaccharyltransferase complex subunit alpha (ribophorin I)